MWRVRSDEFLLPRCHTSLRNITQSPLRARIDLASTPWKLSSPSFGLRPDMWEFGINLVGPSPSSTSSRSAKSLVFDTKVLFLIQNSSFLIQKSSLFNHQIHHFGSRVESIVLYAKHVVHQCPRSRVSAKFIIFDTQFLVFNAQFIILNKWIHHL